MSGSASGLPLHVESVGPEDGRPLVLLHGFGANSWTWRHWTGPLAVGHRVHLVDMKGHGRAPRPRDGAYAPRDHAALVLELLRRLDARRLTLVGHSLGGGIALLTALGLLDQEPARLDSLVLVSSAALPQEVPRFIGLARIPVLAQILFTLTPSRWLIRTVLRSIVHDPSAVEEAQVEAYAAPLADRHGRRALLQTARAIVPPDLDRIVARYPEIDVPTLLLWGRRDPVVPPAVGRALRDALPRATLRVLDDCGHIPPEELPERSLAPVLRFLEEREAPPTEAAPEGGCRAS